MSSTRPRRCARSRCERRRRAVGDHRGDERARRGELLGRHGREVLVAQDLVRAVADAVGLAVGRRRLAARARVAAHALGVLVQRARIDLAARRHAHRAAQEPGLEGAVEGLEVLAPGDERGAQRPVDVVLARDVDAVQAAQRVLHAPRPDLQAGLAQHAAEGDEVACEGLAHAPAAAAAARASPISATTASSRTRSKSS